MSRIFLIVVAVGVLVAVIGVLVLGAFPPTPSSHPVEKVLQNDKFQTR